MLFSICKNVHYIWREKENTMEEHESNKNETDDEITESQLSHNDDEKDESEKLNYTIHIQESQNG